MFPLIILTSSSFVTLVVGIQELTETNFDDVVKNNTNVLVEFYAPWCGYCKKFKPVYDQIAEDFKAQKNLVIARVNAETQFKLTHRFKVTDLPAIRFFSEGDKEKGEKFEGDLDEEDVGFFVQEMLDGGRGDDADDLDDDAGDDPDAASDWGKMAEDLNAMNDALSKSVPDYQQVQHYNCKNG